MKTIAAAAAVMTLALLIGCAVGQKTAVQITEESVTVWTPDGASATVPMDNLTFHGLENLPAPTPVPASANLPTPYPTPMPQPTAVASDAYEKLTTYEDFLEVVSFYDENSVAANQKYKDKKILAQAPISNVHEGQIILYIEDDDDRSYQIEIWCFMENPDLNLLATLRYDHLVTVQGEIEIGTGIGIIMLKDCQIIRVDKG